MQNLRGREKGVLSWMQSTSILESRKISNRQHIAIFQSTEKRESTKPNVQ